MPHTDSDAATGFDSDSAAGTDLAAGLFQTLRERMGWDDRYLAEVEDPHYPALRDLDRMVEALRRIREDGLKIVVLPDYDMDGISSGVLGYAGLCELGFDAELYVPDYARGHDIQPEALDELAARHPGAAAVITCDGGVNSHAGIQRGRDLGLAMLVTDHHLQLPTNPDGSAHSPAHVLVDPCRLDEDYPHPGICGAFVLYQVLEAYAREHAPEKAPDIALLKLFAGLGTVSDVMPLRFENRQLVRDSLSLAQMLRHPLPAADQATPYEVGKSTLMTLLNAQSLQGRHHPAFVAAFRGFAFVLQSWREEGKLTEAHQLDAELYGFYIAPAFNAPRRILAPMKTAFEVFASQDPDRQLAAAREVIAFNNTRKELSEQWSEEIRNRPQPLAPHVWLTDAPAGMLGLLAGKLCSDLGIPVVVAHDPGDPDLPHSGSARAPAWFQVVSSLSSHGFRAVGHEQACGVHAASLAQLEEIARLLAEETDQAQKLLQADADPGYDLVLGLDAPGHTAPDGPLSDNRALLEMAGRVDALAPFGHGFPRPRYRIVASLADATLTAIGEDKAHLRITLATGLKLLWWGEARMLPDLEEASASPIPGQCILELDADLSVHRFMGNESVQAVVRRLAAGGDGGE